MREKLGDRELEALIITTDIPRIHTPRSFYFPSMWETIISFHQDAEVMSILGIRIFICTEAIMPCHERTIMETLSGITVKPQMESHEAVVMHVDVPILVVDGR